MPTGQCAIEIESAGTLQKAARKRTLRAAQRQPGCAKHKQLVEAGMMPTRCHKARAARATLTASQPPPTAAAIGYHSHPARLCSVARPARDLPACTQQPLFSAHPRPATERKPGEAGSTSVRESESVRGQSRRCRGAVPQHRAAGMAQANGWRTNSRPAHS